MKRINFYLTDEEILYLKTESRKTQLSASDIVRRLIDKQIKAKANKKNENL